MLFELNYNCKSQRRGSLLGAIGEQDGALYWETRYFASRGVLFLEEDCTTVRNVSSKKKKKKKTKRRQRNEVSSKKKQRRNRGDLLFANRRLISHERLKRYGRARNFHRRLSDAGTRVFVGTRRLHVPGKVIPKLIALDPRSSNVHAALYRDATPFCVWYHTRKTKIGRRKEAAPDLTDEEFVALFHNA